MSDYIIFSDPRSTTLVQIATRDGSQTSTWLGQMKFANLKVFNGQNRNSTATFTIFGYNSSDTIDNWMVPGIEVFVVRDDRLRFSGVTSKIDGDYVGYDLSQTYRITCESDANWLLNRTNSTKNGVVHEQQTALTILMDVLDPDTMWYNGALGSAMGQFDGVQKMDYTISSKPALVQIQELASVSGMKYAVRGQASRATITSWGATASVTRIPGDDHWITTTSSTIGKGTHNKWVCLYTGATPAVCAITASSADTSINPSSTNAINYSQFVNGQNIIILMHPILEFKPSLVGTGTKTLYINPSSTLGVLNQSPCWQYSPLAEKNDVITKVTADGMDGAGNPISISLAAAFPYDSSSRKFLMDTTFTEKYVALEYDTENLIDTGHSASPKHQVHVYDDVVGWSNGDLAYIVRHDGTVLVPGNPANQESFIATTVTRTGETINGRPTVWLLPSVALSYDYIAGDIVSPSYGYSIVWVNNTTGFVADAYYWIGTELVKFKSVQSATIPGSILVQRAFGFVSSNGSTTRTKAIAHKKYCPIMDGMPGTTGYSQKAFDRDDYYGKGMTDEVYDAPIKIYGINTKHITVNKAVDAGTLELVCYNVLRNSCRPKYKGNLSCFIDALVDQYYPYNTMRPGDTFTVNYFDTRQPPSPAVYEIMSMDMDFDSGTCVVQFDEYDISLMMALANMGLSINIT